MIKIHAQSCQCHKTDKGRVSSVAIISTESEIVVLCSISIFSACPFVVNSRAISLVLLATSLEGQLWIRNQFGVGRASSPHKNLLTMETSMSQRIMVRLWLYYPHGVYTVNNRQQRQITKDICLILHYYLFKNNHSPLNSWFSYLSSVFCF